MRVWLCVDDRGFKLIIIIIKKTVQQQRGTHLLNNISVRCCISIFSFTGVLVSHRKWEERKYRFLVSWTRGTDRWVNILFLPRIILTKSVSLIYVCF